MYCPDCDSALGVTTQDHKEFFHIYEICAYCGYTKAYVDYKNSDTGEINWSGIDH